MVEPLDLRKALATFLGGDRYRRFVEQGFRRGKLRYWQEEEWIQFTAAHPEFAVGLDELAAAVRGCERHGEAWQRGRRFATTAAALVGGLLGAAVHIAIVYGGWLLYVRLYPLTGTRFEYLLELVYAGFALCATPLSMLFGAYLGVWWVRVPKIDLR